MEDEVSNEVQHVLAYPSVRRVVDSLFGVTNEPLAFTDAISGSFAILLFCYFCFVAVRQAWKQFVQHSARQKSRAVPRSGLVAPKSAPRRPNAANTKQHPPQKAQRLGRNKKA